VGEDAAVPDLNPPGRRQTMATLARKSVGEANWRRKEDDAGHVKASIRDIYAIPDPTNLGLVLAATESIIGEIEKIGSRSALPRRYREREWPPGC